MNPASLFVHLHLHTEYSISDGLIRIKPLMQTCVKANMPAVAITDQSNMFGVIKFYKEAIAKGVKPIIGVDIWLHNEENPQKPFKMVLLAQNKVGYKNLLNIVSKSYLEGQIASLPMVKTSWLEELHSGIIALSGGINGDIGQAILSNKKSLAEKLLTYWQKIFPNRFYLELQRTQKPFEENYIEIALNLAEKYQIPVVATNGACFLTPNDFEAHEARVCIHNGCVLEDPKRPKNYTEQQYLRTASEMIELFIDIPEAIFNTVEIAKRCNVEISLGETFLPIFPTPNNVSVEEFFTSAAKEGLEKRLQILFDEKAIDFAEKRKIYDERLNLEIDVIKQMGFASYFLIVADFIAWAKKNDIPVGPGRGSGAGSLVAYSLEITGVDPIEHELLFERFLNPERVSMPDFDVDFCMEGRDRVIEYVMNHYGKNRASQIITYGTMAAKASIRDIGRVLGYSYSFVDKIAKLVPFELGITLERAMESEELLKKRYDEEPEVKNLIDLAMKIEGITRNASKHAAGVVIAPTLLTDFIPLYCEAGDNIIVSQFDKDDVEAIGLVKFDFLGLRTLTIIDWAVKNINHKKITQNESPIDISRISLNDEKTYELIQSGATTAVFQIESRGMRDLIKRLKLSRFNDVVALVALYRPGPLQSGMLDDFVSRMQGGNFSYLHPTLNHILSPTYGVIVYQEQVMQIAQVLAGYSLGGADILRRAMGKKKPEEMAKQRAIFLEGAANKNIDKHLANNIFDLMEKFAAYGFNKSHSVAYALVTYQTAWLKNYYPAEFMAAVLSSDMDNTDKIVVFVNECKNLNLTILPPNINIGNYMFEPLNSSEIIFGLGAIKGAGKAALDNIFANRGKYGKFKNLFDFCKRVDGRKVNKKVLEALVKSGAFDNLGPSRAAIYASLPLAMRAAEKHIQDEMSGQLDLFADDSFSDENNETEYQYVSMPEWPLEEKLKNEKDVLGFYLSGHPISTQINELKKLTTHSIAEIANIPAKLTKIVTIAGIVVAIKIINTKTGNKMAVVSIEDDKGKIDVTVFAEKLTEKREILVSDQLIIIEGEVSLDNFSGENRIRASDIMTLEEARKKFATAIVLKIASDKISEQCIDDLHEILSIYRGGKLPVYITYKNQAAVAKIFLGDEWKINISNELLENLKKYIDNDNIVIIYKK